jgi:NAD(P)-dependent dehydrogenase (short-subunit alcohol dehydrogenase family)
MGRLDDRVAIVTGGGRGIGAAVARLMAAEGAKVVVADLGVELDGRGADPSLAQVLVDSIVGKGGSAAARFVDVAAYRSAEQLIEFSVDTYGGLDVLVNAAGILRDRMVFNMSEDDWDSVIDVHLKGCFNTTKFASVYWRKAKAGNYRLINFTSIAGLYGNPTQPNYAAAKMAIVGLTRSCANALAKYGVTANCISPGASTRMTLSIPPDRLQEFMERTGQQVDDPSRSADNVAPAVLYLASTDSAWLTGRVIGAQGYRISLWTNPEIKRQITSTGPWTLDQVFAEMPRAFLPATQGGRRLDEAG